jgi:hypothetical protein
MTNQLLYMDLVMVLAEAKVLPGHLGNIPPFDRMPKKHTQF